MVETLLIHKAWTRYYFTWKRTFKNFRTIHFIKVPFKGRNTLQPNSPNVNNFKEYIVLYPFDLFKTTRDPNKLGTGEILVEHMQCTCCPHFRIIKGALNIPPAFDLYFPSKPNGINISGTNTPFDYIDKKQSNYHLIMDNQFVFSGHVVGVDSLDFSASKNDCSILPVFKVDSWSPTKYHAQFWTLSSIGICIYLAT